MDDVAALMSELRTRDPGRPRLTWYGPGGERVELSGKWLDNWVAKTAGLLVDEYDAEPGLRVVMQPPLHWRTVVWSLATWLTGACLAIPAEGMGARDGDIVVGPDLLATDEVRLYDDVFVPGMDPDDAALEVLDHLVVHRDLLPLARDTAPPPRSRVLLGPESVDPLRTWLPALATNGSVVIHHNLAGLTPEQRAALVQAERIS